VPFVLAIGIGFSKAVNASQGFGMLTIMSVAPIISVLCTSLLRKPAAVVRQASMRSAKSALSTLSKMSRGGSLTRNNAGLTAALRSSSVRRWFDGSTA
jgi:hypothetical protein